MKELKNDTGIMPMPGYLIIEMFERPKSGIIVRLDNQTQPAPEEQDVYVLEHTPGKDWEFNMALEPGTQILAVPTDRMIPGFLEKKRYVYIIAESNLLGTYEYDPANN